jgi:serine/threonine protein kinase
VLGILTDAAFTRMFPFDPTDERQMQLEILSEWSGLLECPDLEYISEEAKDLLRILLEESPRRRNTHKKVLNHPWFDEIRKNRESEQKAKEGMGFGRSSEEIRECQKEKIQKQNVFWRETRPDRSLLEF